MTEIWVGAPLEHKEGTQQTEDELATKGHDRRDQFNLGLMQAHSCQPCVNNMWKFFSKNNKNKTDFNKEIPLFNNATAMDLIRSYDESVDANETNRKELYETLLYQSVDTKFTSRSQKNVKQVKQTKLKDNKKTPKNKKT